MTLSLLGISIVEILKNEWLGLIASAFVLISFLTSNQIKTRIINMIGCIVFVVYGFLLPTYSTAFMNSAVLIVHIVFLVKYFIKKRKEKKAGNVEKAFEFLIENGFSLKKNLRAPDEEYVYSKNDIVLEVDYYSGVLPDGTNGMCVAVILTVNEERNNLLNCDKIFDSSLLEALKNKIDAATPSEQIAIYADFIKTNVDTLSSL